MARKAKKSKMKAKAKKVAKRTKRKAKRAPAKKAKAKKPSKANRAKAKKVPSVKHPGMMGDGTEEQNLNQPGNPEARIKKDEVNEVFGNLKK